MASQPVKQLRERRTAAPATNAQVYKFKTAQRAGTGGFLPRRGRSQALSLRLDPVPEHKVCQQPQGKEENAQDQEVHVEFGLLHIQLTQDDLWVPEWALVI